MHIFFAGKNMHLFFFFTLQPVRQCTYDQQITGAIPGSCRYSAQLSAHTSYRQTVTEWQEKSMNYEDAHQRPRSLLRTSRWYL